MSGLEGSGDMFEFVYFKCCGGRRYVVLMVDLYCVSTLTSLPHKLTTDRNSGCEKQWLCEQFALVQRTAVQTTNSMTR